MSEPLRCERCGKDIDEHQAVYLDLSLTDGRYWIELPSDHESQGGFAFGAHCASKVAADSPLN